MLRQSWENQGMSSRTRKEDENSRQEESIRVHHEEEIGT